MSRPALLALVGDLAIYSVVVGSTPFVKRAANTFIELLNLEIWVGPFEPSVRGYADCRTKNCYDMKINRSVRIRALSSAAGLWMTLDGGFPGNRYPNTPEKLAYLMLAANPWCINDRFDVTRAEWIKIGSIQSPYLGFGAGYGLLPLLMVMDFIGAVCCISLRSLKNQSNHPMLTFHAFYIVNAIFNQTQSWLLSGPILFVMGSSGTSVLWQFLMGKSLVVVSRSLRC